MNGAHLASVHSDQEAQFLSTLMSHISGRFKAWIGLERAGNSFAWSDGSEFDYQNWNAGEPNHWNEKCVSQYHEAGKSHHEKWNDETCHSLVSFICKKPAMGNNLKLTSP